MRQFCMGVQSYEHFLGFSRAGAFVKSGVSIVLLYRGL